MDFDTDYDNDPDDILDNYNSDKTSYGEDTILELGGTISHQVSANGSQIEKLCEFVSQLDKKIDVLQQTIQQVIARQPADQQKAPEIAPQDNEQPQDPEAQAKKQADATETRMCQILDDLEYTDTSKVDDSLIELTCQVLRQTIYNSRRIANVEKSLNTLMAQSKTAPKTVAHNNPPNTAQITPSGHGMTE